ncbi:dienelactone hydrolase family protein [Bacillus massiliigorillae]|uniref:dienelactone hydrolase family protein n=1 Tax=Bacillus massiliigorillae TaxID=1243664 RepID=UPI00039BD60E|nr:dienelactone hydrolase family protein [Bacillus massiliigorillae]
MIQIHNQSEILVIVIHEIYGLNQHMQDVCNVFAENGFDVLCPNLLHREEPFSHDEEEIAYNYFMRNIGFMNATNKVKELVKEMNTQYRAVILIGFSIGATIAWLSSEEEGVNGVVGFYGSRIRDYLHITPQCPILLFFPKKEPSFQVEALLSKLIQKNIECVMLEGLHGCLNPYAPKYDEQSAQMAFRKVTNFLSRFCGQ